MQPAVDWLQSSQNWIGAAMKILSKSAIVLSALGFATASAFAQAPTTPKQPGMNSTSPQGQTMSPGPAPSGATGGSASSMKPTFESLDKDHDGSISRSEAAGSADLVKSFATLDKNRDGKLDRTEFSGASLTK